MPIRSSIELLPEEVRTQLNQKLIENSFSGYDALSAWLTNQGYGISKSAIHRYGQGFEERLNALKIATEQARAIAEVAGDDANFLGDAMIRVYQQKIFELLLKLEISDDPEYDLPKIGKMIAGINATSITQKRYMDEVRNRTQKVASEVEETVKQQGLSDEAAAEIRAKIMGISNESK